MKSVSALLCLVPLAAATRNIAELSYTVAKEYVDETCEYPALYTIEGFTTFTATATNETTINFGYTDSDTNITTTCTKNSTAVNIGDTGAAPRYACENSLAQFIWQNNKLTVIEQACEKQYDASGSWIPNLTCEESESGDGTECTLSGNTTYAGKFTSLEPASSGAGPTRRVRRIR